MARIPEEVIRRVRSETDLVELISLSVRLRRAGQNFVGLCPFHQEKSPSFNVSKKKNFYHCYGCKESGDAIDWVIHQEDASFKDAVLMLAKDLGIDVQGGIEGEWNWTLKDPPPPPPRPLLHTWPESSIARFANRMPKYMIERGIMIDTAKAYEIGYDREEKRATFPVRKPTGELVGMSGRSTIGAKLKYMHYRIDQQEWRAIARIPRHLYDSMDEDEIEARFARWPKARTLYGAHVVASQALAPAGGWRDGNLYLVEGHIDVHAFYQRRLRAVASMGSSVSAEQGDMLAELVPVRGNLVICPDPDMLYKKPRGSEKTLFELYVLNIKEVIYERHPIWHLLLPGIRVPEGRDVAMMMDEELDACVRVDPANVNDDEFETAYAKLTRLA
jgi:DNA primase